MTVAPHFNLPYLGYGLGLRTTHYPYILEHFPQEISWFEIISENFMESEGRPRTVLEQVRDRYDVVMHGVSLSIGSTDALDREYLKKLKVLAEWVKPAWISDHICWTGVGGGHSHDLLPIPYTEDALQHVVSRIKQAQDFLGRPILLENPSSYVSFKDNVMPEAEFIARMAEEADCALLLDINNVFVSCFNQRQDVKQWLDVIPLERVVQIHLAGHLDKGGYRIDTHDHPVSEDVWQMYRYVCAKRGLVSTMVEWDADIPAFPIVLAEVMKAKHVVDAVAAMPNTLADFSQKIGDYCAPRLPLSQQMEVMQEAIIGKNTPERSALASWIIEHEGFAAQQQLGVYREGYTERLKEILTIVCPIFVKYLGQEKADTLFSEYIQTHPSTYYNLNKYCDDFPAFAALHEDEVAADIACLEVVMDQIYDAPESLPLSTEWFADLDEESCLHYVFIPRAALKMIDVKKKSLRIYEQLRGDIALQNKGGGDADETQSILIVRDNDVVQRVLLENTEALFLRTLFAGQTMEDVCAKYETNVEPEDVQRWFSKWMTHKLFAAY